MNSKICVPLHQFKPFGFTNFSAAVNSGYCHTAALFDFYLLLFNPGFLRSFRGTPDDLAYFMEDRLNYNSADPCFHFLNLSTDPIMDIIDRNGALYICYKGTFDLPSLKKTLSLSPFSHEILFYVSDLIPQFTFGRHPNYYNFYDLNKYLVDIDRTYRTIGLLHLETQAIFKTFTFVKSQYFKPNAIYRYYKYHYNILVHANVNAIRRVNLNYSKMIDVLDIKMRCLTAKYIKICLRFQQNEFEKENLFNELRELYRLSNVVELSVDQVRKIRDICCKIFYLGKINVMIEKKYDLYEEVMTYSFFKIQRASYGFFNKQLYDSAIDAVLDPLKKPLAALRRSNVAEFEDLRNEEKNLMKYREEDLINYGRRLYDDPYKKRKKNKFGQKGEGESGNIKKKIKLTRQLRRTPWLIFEKKKRVKGLVYKEPKQYYEAAKLSRPAYKHLYLTYIFKHGSLQNYPSVLLVVLNHFFPKLFNPNRYLPHLRFAFKTRPEEVRQFDFYLPLAALGYITNRGDLSVLRLMTQDYGYPVGDSYHKNASLKIVTEELHSHKPDYDYYMPMHSARLFIYTAVRTQALRKVQNYYLNGDQYDELQDSLDFNKHAFLLKDLSMPSLRTLIIWYIYEFWWWLKKPQPNWRLGFILSRRDDLLRIQDECRSYLFNQRMHVAFDPSLQRDYYSQLFGCYDEKAIPTIMNIMDEYIMKDKKFDMSVKEKVRYHLENGGSLRELMVVDNEIPLEFKAVFDKVMSMELIYNSKMDEYEDLCVQFEEAMEYFYSEAFISQILINKLGKTIDINTTKLIVL